MHILYVVHAYKPAYRIGGPAVSVSSAAEALVRKGHRVTVFTTSSNLDQELDVPLDQPVPVEGVEVWYFHRRELMQRWLPFVPYLSRSMGFMYAPAMKHELRRMMPTVDVVDTHMPFIYPTFAAARAAFRAGKPLFYHQRGNFDPARLQFRGPKKRLYISLIERPIMRRAAVLMALTEAERSSFRALGVTTRCEIVPNGIDLPEQRPDAAARVAGRWGIPPDVPMVLFLGRLHPIKGADTLLEAFAEVQKRVPRAVLMMAGPDEWGLEAEWRARVTAQGLADHVVFPGMLLGEEKADVLARADLFSLPSVGEGFSMAVLEALAASTAVVLSPGCNFPEVEAAGAGVVVERAPNVMADALVALLSDPSRLREMGEAGRSLVGSRYSWDVVAERLAGVYRSAL